MKKLLLTGALLAASQFIFGQTLTKANLKTYVAGHAYIDHTDTIQTFVPDAGGTGKTWNFSRLASHLKDTSEYVAIAGTPGASAFPTSTVAEYSKADNSYDYYTVSNDGIYVNSLYIYNPLTEEDVTAKFEPALKLASLPASFGTTWTSVSSAKAEGTYNGNAIRVTATVDSKGEVDASGTLLLPEASYNNVLRIKTYTHTSFKVESNSPIGWITIPGLLPDNFDTLYTWIADGEQVLSLSAATATSSSGGQDSDGYYATYSTTYLTTAIDNTFLPGVSLALFPNPVQDRFQVSGVRQVISISDLTGKEVAFSSNSISAGMVEVQLSTPEKGLYTVQTLDNQGVKKALKFAVVK